MNDSQFARLVQVGIAFSGKSKWHFGKLIGLKYPSDLSAMLGGYRKWPEDVKQHLIDELNLEHLIQWVQEEQQKRLKQEKVKNI